MLKSIQEALNEKNDICEKIDHIVDEKMEAIKKEVIF
jgi:hypothetical protein